MKHFLICLLACLLANIESLLAQQEDLSQVWPAHWITAAEGSPKAYGVQYFRRNFSLDSVPEELVVHSSGDMRYQLFVNGQMVTWGPLTGDLRHWFYESTNIAAYLRQGENVIAAAVLNYGAFPPDARLTVQTGFLLAADDKAFRFLNTGQNWKSLPNQAYAPNRVDKDQINGYYGGGSREIVDGRALPWGWQEVDYDDAEWAEAERVERAYAKGCRWASRWKLTPRTLPHERMTPGRFVAIRMHENAQVKGDFIEGKGKLTIAANTEARLILDWGHETTAYPQLQLSDGQDAELTLTYVEAPYIGNPKSKDKCDRNEVDGKNFVGYVDQYIANGADNQRYKPMWWRAFRYVELKIKTGAQPLIIDDISAIHATYPFDLRASFKVNGQPDLDKKLKRMWDIGHRTLQACSHEHFMDCPYYEESQFEGDTRIEALISYSIYGDSSLGKQAIEQFAWSINDEGFLSARYPTNSLYYIPNYSLYWIGMLFDYYMRYDDPDFIQEKLWVMRQVLGYFERNARPDGSIRPLDYHQFVDWSFPKGEGPTGPNGYSALSDLHMLMALQWAAELETGLGDAFFAGRYRQHAELLGQAIQKRYWKPEAGLFADTPEGDKFSQFTNSLAILTGVAPTAKVDSIMARTLRRKDLTQATLYGSFYVFEALAETGLADQYLSNLQVWEEVMALNVTTWPETGARSRSECHGWGASPNYHLLKIIAGIRPLAASFKEVEIRPALGDIPSLSVRMPHPDGFIKMDLEQADGRMSGQVSLPPGVSGTLIWKKKQIQLTSGNQRIDF